MDWCGKPLWQRNLHEAAADPGLTGCGCPITEKARDPGEHCPLHVPADPGGNGCPCRWCRAD